MSDPVDLTVPGAPPFALGAGEVHLWYLFSGAQDDPERDSRCRAIMSKDELEREARFAFPRDQLTFRLTRALVRRVLSRYAPVPCAQWRFTTNLHGRPEIDPQFDTDGLDFNVSHTAGLIGCAVARQRRIGFDVENRNRPIDLDHYDDYLAPSELRDLLSLRAGARHEAFYAQWTLKEAYLKATGIGLALSPTDFAIGKDRSGQLRIDHAPDGAETGLDWHLFKLYPSREHSGGLAVEMRAAPVRLSERMALI
jgi:4'-phosphopantetheinyl transferase